MRRGKNEYGSAPLNETGFWLDAMAEHAAMLAERAGGTKEIASQAEEFSYVFSTLKKRLEKLKSSRKLPLFLEEANEVVRDFQAFLEMAIQEKCSGGLNETAQLFWLEHIFREGELCRGNLDDYQKKPLKRSVTLDEISSWIEIVFSHTLFVQSALEHAERRLARMFAEYVQEWRDILLECRYLSRLAAAQHIDLSVFKNFVGEIHEEAVALQKAYAMLSEIKCEGRPVLSLSKLELAHIQREMEHFVYLSTAVIRYSVQPAAEEKQEPIELAALAKEEEIQMTEEPQPEDMAAAKECTPIEPIEMEADENQRAETGVEPVIAVMKLPDETEKETPETSKADDKSLVECIETVQATEPSSVGKKEIKKPVLEKLSDDDAKEKEIAQNLPPDNSEKAKKITREKLPPCQTAAAPPIKRLNGQTAAQIKHQIRTLGK